MNICIQEVMKAMRACTKETGKSRAARTFAYVNEIPTVPEIGVKLEDLFKTRWAIAHKS